jgi:hypothetical protein
VSLRGRDRNRRTPVVGWNIPMTLRSRNCSLGSTMTGCVLDKPEAADGSGASGSSGMPAAGGLVGSRQTSNRGNESIASIRRLMWCQSYLSDTCQLPTKPLHAIRCGGIEIFAEHWMAGVGRRPAGSQVPSTWPWQDLWIFSSPMLGCGAGATAQDWPFSAAEW